MDRGLKLEAKLPVGDANGLNNSEIIGALMNDPDQLRVGIVMFNVPKIETDRSADTETGKIRIARIEVILDNRFGDVDALRRLIQRAFERRTGATTLDSALEEDLRSAFDGIVFDEAEDRGDE